MTYKEWFSLRNSGNAIIPNFGTNQCVLTHYEKQAGNSLTLHNSLEIDMHVGRDSLHLGVVTSLTSQLTYFLVTHYSLSIAI